MAAGDDEQAVRIALASAGLTASDAEVADLGGAYRGLRELAERISAVPEADDENADLIFRPRG